MNNLISMFGKSFSFNNNLVFNKQREEIRRLELPEDYLSFILKQNGGEGFIGEMYLILWKLEELIQFNKEYEVHKYANGIFLFGSNGSGEGFGFDMRTKPYKVIEIPFIGMDIEYAIPVANNFTDFINKIGCSDGSLI